MAMIYKGIPVPVLVGLIVLILGGIIHIIGLATPYWHVVTKSTSSFKDQPNGHHGLWLVCSNVNLDVVDCRSHGEGKAIDEVADYIKAVRALIILALLFGVACVIITGLWFFLNIQSHRLILMIASLGTGFIAGLFGLIGIIVYAAEINSKRSTSTGILYSYNLSWSFALCVISSCMVIISTILIALGTRMMKN